MVSQLVGAKILIPLHRQSRSGNHERKVSRSVITVPVPWFSHAQFPFDTSALTGRSSLQAAEPEQPGSWNSRRPFTYPKL